MRELLGDTIGRELFTTSLLSTFAALALLLAAVGLYGVLSQIVNGRPHEFGVRMALGADRLGIRRLVLRAGLLATLAGLAIGAFLAGAGLRVLRTELEGSPTLSRSRMSLLRPCWSSSPLGDGHSRRPRRAARSDAGAARGLNPGVDNRMSRRRLPISRPAGSGELHNG